MYRCYRYWLPIWLLSVVAHGFKLPFGRPKTHNATTETETETETATEKYALLVDWMRSNGGRVDERFGLMTRSNDNLEGATGRGVVALQDIAVGTELLFCPWDLVFGTVGDTAKVPPETDPCDTLNAYADHVRAGKDSFWYPYLSMDDSLDTRIPTIWNSALTELQGLLPDAAQGSSMATWFSNSCAGGTPFDQLDPAARQSLLAAITRSAGMRFLPVFDLMNHHNGLLNTRSNAAVDGNSVFAAVDIPKGSEIFNSYKGGLATSSDIFRRYGFVESWPQQWTWTDTDAIATSATTTEAKEERFLLLPDNVVVIYPPASMTDQIGVTAPLPLANWQADSKLHNLQLGADKLAGFAESAKRLLESLPSTAEEDTLLLEQLEVLATQRGLVSSSDPSSDRDAILLSDRMSAIAYRIKFKDAVQTALDVAIDTRIAHHQDIPELKSEL
ncbi:expressed unknown protein [Seminavis robusta]|uniref:SET domain-containing protein n=1 Tax=Seminavis robusta TaxID=568900 RepID=A0A9N8EDM2_9STRA|nr:expressed unknown protein [Seminavis robusta]|eukprot:Sro842_g209710.1 n/a (445) ;mRNA; f:27537-28871